jgi:hypothetical protein
MRRGEDFLDAHAFDALPKVLAVDAVAVAEEIGGCGVVREGVDELLGGPGGGGMLGDAARDLVSLDFFTIPTAGLRVLFVLVVLAHHRRRVVHFWEGGVRRFGSSRETVRSATLIPSGF